MPAMYSCSVLRASTVAGWSTAPATATTSSRGMVMLVEVGGATLVVGLAALLVGVAAVLGGAVRERSRGPGRQLRGGSAGPGRALGEELRHQRAQRGDAGARARGGEGGGVAVRRALALDDGPGHRPAGGALRGLHVDR